jgi:Negative regulator of sigma E activity
MSVDLNETLSAMMDGEANELETHRALKSMGGAGSATWQRYQTVSSILKQDKSLFLGSDVSALVSAAIAEEKPHKQSAFTAWKPVASFATAAAVTLAVFIGVQTNQTGVSDFSPTVAAADVTAQEAASRVSAGAQGLSLTANEGFATASAQLVSQNTQLATERAVADAIAAERLQSYLEQHTAHSVHNANQGVLPFARVEEAQSR